MTTTTTVPRRARLWSILLWACLISVLASSDSLVDLALNAGMAVCFISGNYRWRWQNDDGYVTNLLYALGASFLLAHYMRVGRRSWTRWPSKRAGSALLAPASVSSWGSRPWMWPSKGVR